MNSLAVVPAFNIAEQRDTSGFKIGIACAVNFFFFQRRMERFNARVIIRTTFVTVRRCDAILQNQAW